MITECPGCGAPADNRLSCRYRYPRPSIEPGAVDPCHVVGGAPLRTCGSVSCQAAALLALVDGIVTDALVLSGHLLSSGDVEIVDIGDPEDFHWAVCDEGGES